MPPEPSGGMHEGENVKHFVRPSPWSYFWWYVVGFLGLLFFFLGAIIIVIAEFHRRGHKFYVTNDRVIREFKFFSRDVNESTYDLITDVSLEQGMLSRMVNIGNVNINTASGQIVTFNGVKDPKQLKNTIARSKNRHSNRAQKVEVVGEEGGTRYCADCGEEVAASSTYCPNCGHEVAETAEQGPDYESILEESISEIKDDINSMDDPDIETLKDLEGDGKNRKSLLDWLESYE